MKKAVKFKPEKWGNRNRSHRAEQVFRLQTICHLSFGFDFEILRKIVRNFSNFKDLRRNAAVFMDKTH